MDTATGGFRPPYMSFQTFWAFLSDLCAKPLPRRLDRSIMQSKSGTDQNNLMAALEGFSFIDGDGMVEPALQRFATASPEQRTEMLSTLVQTFYRSVLRVSADNGSPAELNTTFRDELGMASSDTRRKAITFFLHAAREAGLELSPHFPKTRAGSGGPGAPKAKRVNSRRKSTTQDSGSGSRVGGQDSAPASGHAQTITLRSGGTVTLTYDVNMFDVDDDDEAFVLGLIKKLRTYRSAALAATTSEQHDDSPVEEASTA